jgi:hypothetical protein
MSKHESKDFTVVAVAALIYSIDVAINGRSGTQISSAIADAGRFVDEVEKEFPGILDDDEV